MLRRHLSRTLLTTLAAATLVVTATAPAHAAGPVRPQDPAPAADAATFTTTLQKDVFIADESMPVDFVPNASGTLGYVATSWGHTMYVVDLISGTVTGSVPLPTEGADYIELSRDGSRAYVSLTDGYWSTGLAEIDLATLTVAREFPAPFSNIIQTALSADGNALFVLGLSGDVAKLNAHTGAVLAQVPPGNSNMHGLTLTPDGSRLLASGKPGLFSYDANDLSLVFHSTTTGFSDANDLTFDGDPSRMYVADGGSSRLGVVDPATGETISSVSVGSSMGHVVGKDDLNRAYSEVGFWDMVMAADFTTGLRSESYRSTPTAGDSLEENPATGDLLVANVGWHGDGNRGNTVSIFYYPSVTDPEDATANALGDVVTLHTDITGIKAHLGGVQWQSSTDGGAAWTDIDGATGNDLAVTVTAETPGTTYRVSWSDDFWGLSGVSAPATISLLGPVITYLGPLADGTVGTEYAPVTLTAEGQADLVWETTTLPDGLRVTPATTARAAAPSAVLSGTPTEAGTFTFTATVTDSFGTDSREYTVVIAEDAVVPPVTPTPTPTATATPTEPGPITPAPTDSAAPTPTPEEESDLAATGTAPLLALTVAGMLLLFGAVMARRRRA